MTGPAPIVGVTAPVAVVVCPCGAAAVPDLAALAEHIGAVHAPVINGTKPVGVLLPIRSWGRLNGWPHLANTGPLPTGLRAAYEQAKATVRGPVRHVAAGPKVPPGVPKGAARDWANVNGWNLGDRGRLPQDAINAFLAHHLQYLPPLPRRGGLS